MKRLLTHLLAGLTLLACPLAARAAPSGSATTAALIEIPASGTRVALPLHLLAHVGRPGELLTVTLRWRDGTYLWSTLQVLRGADGRGLLVGDLDWTHEVGPLPTPPTQSASLEVRTQPGRVLARSTLIVLSPRDPATRRILLYWVLGDRVYPRGQLRTIVATPRVGLAALTELLWGPGPRNFAGFTTALPTPTQVLRYPGRPASWGERVTVRGLRIVDGVATADFSRELQAYGGGALRVRLIREQITQTLLQFPTIHQVRITVQGQAAGALEP